MKYIDISLSIYIYNMFIIQQMNWVEPPPASNWPWASFATRRWTWNLRVSRVARGTRNQGAEPRGRVLWW